MLDKNSIKITDFHSHILPFMDDGSKSVEESLAMLRLLKSQGVDRVVLTPHFYPKQEDPGSFLKRRSESTSMLKSAISFDGVDKNAFPEILVGAEVAYFNGMSLYKDLKSLCIEGTNVLLLEMPFYKWTDVVVNEVCRMNAELGIDVVLAHIDRYYQYVDHAKMFKLKTYRVRLQLNADPFLRFMSGRRSLKLLSSGNVSALGSDCHNMEDRASNMGDAIEIIKARGYGSKLNSVMANTDVLLKNATPLV